MPGARASVAYQPGPKAIVADTDASRVWGAPMPDRDGIDNYILRPCRSGAKRAGWEERRLAGGGRWVLLSRARVVPIQPELVADFLSDL